MVFGVGKKRSSGEELREVIPKAVRWLAAEHYFFKELKHDLDELKRDLEEAKSKESVAGVKKAFRDFRYVGKAERRLERFEEHIENALEAVKTEITVTGNLKEIEQMREKLHVEAGFLIKNASWFEGKIKEYLTHLRDEIRGDEKEKAEATLMEVSQVIEDCEKWLAALSGDFEEARQVYADLVKESGHRRRATALLKEANHLFGLTKDHKLAEVAHEYVLAGNYDLALKYLKQSYTFRNWESADRNVISDFFQCYRHLGDARMALKAKILLDNHYEQFTKDDIQRYGVPHLIQEKYLIFLQNMGTPKREVASVLASVLEEALTWLKY